METAFLNSLIGLAEIVAINVALSGDNAVVIGLAAAGLPAQQRRQAILIGIVAATLLRVVFAVLAGKMLHLFGLLFIGGLLLCWVAWKMWCELRKADSEEPAEAGTSIDDRPHKTLAQAISQIVIADVSMSLDNVLAVAGVARDDMPMLVIGLAISIALMGVAASVIAELLNRWRWLAYAGVCIVAYVAVTMTWSGAWEMINRV